MDGTGEDKDAQCAARKRTVEGDSVTARSNAAVASCGCLFTASNSTPPIWEGWNWSRAMIQEGQGGMGTDGRRGGGGRQ